MGLYDIMDEIAAKQVTKTDTGDSRIMGVVVGIVAKNYDASMPGRVCVQIPVRDSNADELKWARVAMPSGGTQWGHYFLPEVGDQVLLAFEQGNIEKPYVIGCIQKDNNKFLTGSVSANNSIKRIVTKNGNTIQIEDNAQTNGVNKDKISIFTSDKEHKLILDNDGDKITLSDKDGKNGITINTNNGYLNVDAENKVTIKVGDNLELIMNGASGTMTLKCDKFKLDATESINVKSNSKLSLSSGIVNAEGSSMVKLESSGMTKIAGTPIKIG